MKFLKKIKELFGKKEDEPEGIRPLPLSVTHPPVVEPVPKPVKPESIPLSKLDIKRNRVKTWRNKTIKKKAHRLPLAKMMNPDKYF